MSPSDWRGAALHFIRGAAYNAIRSVFLMGGLKSRQRETANLAEVRTQRNHCLPSPFKIDSAD